MRQQPCSSQRIVVLEVSGVSMTRRLYALVLTAVAAIAVPLQAQVRPQPQDPKPGVPRTHLPPPGMCRIWLDNVPAAQQPAPTDCANAVRNQPRNARVIFGDDPRTPKLPLPKSLKDPAPPPPKTPDEQPRPPVKTRPDPKPIKPDSR
jgi:hypothetical protein